MASTLHYAHHSRLSLACEFCVTTSFLCRIAEIVKCTPDVTGIDNVMASTVTDMVGSDPDTGSLSLEIGVLAVSSSVGNDASVFSGGGNAIEDHHRGGTGAERIGDLFSEYPSSKEKRMSSVSTGTSPPPQIASTQVIFAQSQRTSCKKYIS